MNRPLLPAALTLAVALSSASPVRAAESSDTCTGYIDALPAVITAQGTWCLRGGLAWASTSGQALRIDANNVTLDCNGHHFQTSTQYDNTSIAVTAGSRANPTVRHCGFMGFLRGVVFTGDTRGGLVEDSVFHSIKEVAIDVSGQDNVIRRNQIALVAYSDSYPGGRGIATRGKASVLDNTISNVVGGLTPGKVFGILSVDNPDGVIRGNVVANVGRSDAEELAAIAVRGPGRVIIRGNSVTSSASNGSGISCDASTQRAKDNVVKGYDFQTVGCSGADNLNRP